MLWGVLEVSRGKCASLYTGLHWKQRLRRIGGGLGCFSRYNTQFSLRLHALHGTLEGTRA